MEYGQLEGHGEKNIRYAVFGIGRYYENRKSQLSDCHVTAFLDHDIYKQGTYVEGIPVYAPDAIQYLEYDHVLLMSVHEEEMREQLLCFGVEGSRILTFLQFKNREIKDIENHFIGNSLHVGSKTVIFFSHDLSLTGAPIVLLYAAILMKEKGYSPVFVSREKGALLNEIQRKGFSVLITNKISSTNNVLMDFIRNSDMLFFNTVTFCEVISDFTGFNKKIFWWIHEGEGSWWKNGDYYIKGINELSVEILAVSNVAKEYYFKHGGKKNVINFPYYIPDYGIFDSNEKESSSKIIFALIGTICKRKAQDIYLKAVLLLEEEERKKAEFWIIGKKTEAVYSKLLMDLSRGIEEVRVIGEKSVIEMKEIYQKIDIVVCPSICDPLPVVVTEGLMYGKVCIASDQTGIAEYITRQENGLLCKSGEPESLRDQMLWLVQNKKKIKTIGKNARKLYENLFTKPKMEERINKILDGI